MFHPSFRIILYIYAGADGASQQKEGGYAFSALDFSMFVPEHAYTFRLGRKNVGTLFLLSTLVYL